MARVLERLELVAALTVVLCCAGVYASTPCAWDSGAGATFDVTSLRSQTSYTVADQFSSDYTYVFNVCANTATVPGAGYGGHGDACNRTNNNQVAPGFQVDRYGNTCHALGAMPSTPVWGLIDSNNPAAGATLQYNGGSQCNVAGEYALQLKMVCDPSADAVPATLPVEVVDTCLVKVIIRSAYACPVECPLVNGQLCNGHGVCGYDSDSKQAACYCNVGWAGVDCSAAATSGDSGMSSEGVVLIIVLILLAGVLGAVGYMYVKLRRLNVDPDSYKGLSGKFNELGTLAG